MADKYQIIIVDGKYDLKSVLVCNDCGFSQTVYFQGDNIQPPNAAEVRKRHDSECPLSASKLYAAHLKEAKIKAGFLADEDRPPTHVTYEAA